MNKYPKRNIKSLLKKFVILEEYQQRPKCCIDLKETLCHLPNVNDSISSFQVLRLSSSITFDISLIKENPKGRRDDLPETLTGTIFNPSLSCVVWPTSVCDFNNYIDYLRQLSHPTPSTNNALETW